MNYACTLAYEGTAYFGWQKTRSGPSIQESLQNALQRLTQEAPLPEAASRTDRGVHARAQVASFALSRAWEPTTLRRALNALLPPDIRITHLAIVPDTFHPTLDAISKEYHYRFSAAPFPDERHTTWHYPYPLNFDAMHRAKARFLGRLDASPFSGRAYTNPWCTLLHIDITPHEIILLADRFLYKMARILAGTLLSIGSSRHSITAPAHGLILYQINYATAIFTP